MAPGQILHAKCLTVLIMNKIFQMAHNSEGATPTYHMHVICYYEKQKQQQKNRAQTDLSS